MYSFESCKKVIKGKSPAGYVNQSSSELCESHPRCSSCGTIERIKTKQFSTIWDAMRSCLLNAVFADTKL